MPKRTDSIFRESSSAKDYIRSVVDREIIKGFRDEYYPEQRLAYLGLPGEKLLDILAWREYLGSATAVEGSGNSDIQQDLETRVMKNRLDHIVDIVYDNIDSILMSDVNYRQLKWPYQIVNLDYCGGLVNKTDDNISNRLDAFRGLMNKQEGTAFLLLLTLNLKDRDKGEMDDLLDDLEIGLEGLGLKNLSECFEQHRNLGYAGRLKIYVPIFFMTNSTRYQYHFSPPILYQGTKQMMHFAIKCIPYRGLAAGRITVPEDYVEVINYPLLLSHESGDLRRFDIVKIEMAF